MNTFILLVSLMLNLGAILAIIILYLRQNRFAESEKRQEKLIREAEELFSVYLLEMKEENEKLISRLQKSKNRNPETNPNIGTKIKQTEATQEEAAALHPLNVPQASLKPAEVTSDEAIEPVLTPGKAYAFRTLKAAYQQNIDIMSQGATEEGLHAQEKDLSGQERQPEDIQSTEARKAKRNGQEQPSEEVYMQSLLNQVLLLQKLGFSVEEIARKLSKGKTEIELLLKFRKNDLEKT